MHNFIHDNGVESTEILLCFQHFFIMGLEDIRPVKNLE